MPYLAEFFAQSQYPWDMLPRIKEIIWELIEQGIEGFSEIKPGVLVGRDVTISDMATIIAPAIIGHRCVIRPGAFIRGNVITGEGCVLGNSCEFKNAILLDGVEVPHFNYVGDSILGNDSHLAAGAICSNLKSDERNVVIHADTDIDTGMRKVGGFLADGANMGCQCVINPGTVIGKNTSAYPLTSIRGVIPADCIIKSMDNIVKRS